MNNNDELNSISLGSAGNNQNGNIPVPPIPPMEESSNVEALNMNENLNATTDNTTSDVAPTGENVPLEPVAPLNYDVPEVINNSNETPFLNEIGTVPPVNNIPNPSENLDSNGNNSGKKTNILIFIIIIVLALTAVGVGVYIFLNTANKSKVILKNMQIEYGQEISLNIDDYAIFENIDKNTCSLDVSNLKSDTIGAKYDFSISCIDKGTYRGSATVVDTTKPEVKTKDVRVGVNGNLEIKSFIASCEDATECSYAYENEDKVKEALTKAGEYEIGIIVKDEANNETLVKAKLIVSDTYADLYLNCSTKTNDYSVLTKLGLNDGEFNKVGIRTYTFTLSEEEYNNLKTNTTNTEITYKQITGPYEFKDEDHTLIITKIISYEELVAEVGSELPTSGGELRDFYNSKGQSCLIGY